MMKYFCRIYFPVLCLTALLFSGCRHEPLVPDAPVISFKNDVQPLLIANCTRSGCHGNERQRLFPLMSFSDVQDESLVVPGKPYKSDLFLAITKKAGSNPMPPDQNLSASAIRIIEIWILQGAKNN